ncbi:MAG TPA: cbb3-type cytochrome oxidase assembly protein CcoS [Chryseosolibacter sp.]|nr:cbb3-type cytochrome oxidase assembly protein CcoS [Chryseosolibacter sp.]
MSIIIILITISLCIAVLFLAIFYWNMKSGQYDDTYTPGVRMLFDNKISKQKNRDGRPDIGAPPSSPQTK